MDLPFIQSIACVFCRLSPITLVAPVVFFSYIPLLVRTVLTLSWSIIIVLALQTTIALPSEFHWTYLLSEFFLGAILSLGFHMANASMNMASQLIDAQMGISAGATFDPVNFQTTSPIGTLFTLLIMVTFFSTNLHYEFLFFLSELFRVAPPATFYQPDATFYKSIGSVFTLGFLIASPVVIVLFLVDVVLALTSRSMPQAQIYFVAIPLKIIIGLFVLAFVIKMCGESLYHLLSYAMKPWEHLRKL
jgi:flagellar biosynthetic protein FliR